LAASSGIHIGVANNLKGRNQELPQPPFQVAGAGCSPLLLCLLLLLLLPLLPPSL
jgi:hypothetical protein